MEWLHYKSWFHFCCAISLSSCYRDEWLARKFNTATKWAVVMTSLPTDIHISNVWSTWCDLIIEVLILYKFWEWQLDLQKIEIRQNEQRHEGLIWFHVIEDHTQPDLVENNNSKITAVDVARFSFYLPSVSFVLSLRLHFWQLSETKKWLSWICDLIGFFAIRNWRLISMHKVSLK